MGYEISLTEESSQWMCSERLTAWLDRVNRIRFDSGSGAEHGDCDGDWESTRPYYKPLGDRQWHIARRARVTGRPLEVMTSYPMGTAIYYAFEESRCSSIHSCQKCDPYDSFFLHQALLAQWMKKRFQLWYLASSRSCSRQSTSTAVGRVKPQHSSPWRMSPADTGGGSEVQGTWWECIRDCSQTHIPIARSAAGSRSTPNLGKARCKYRYLARCTESVGRWFFAVQLTCDCPPEEVKCPFLQNHLRSSLVVLAVLRREWRLQRRYRSRNKRRLRLWSGRIGYPLQAPRDMGLHAPPCSYRLFAHYPW